MPVELARRETRLKKIREAKAALEAQARAEAASPPDDDERPLTKGGQPAKKTGPKPKVPPGTPKDSAQRNFTDPESRIQKTKDGFIQGYNAQVAVDEEHQVIVAQHVTSAAPDVRQLVPAVEEIEKNLGEVPAIVLADAGYWSEANVEALEARGIRTYIAPGRQKHGGPASPAPRGRIPAGLTPKELMARKLSTVVGRAQYARRKVIAEPPFGQIKAARNFRAFLRRGMKKVSEEWALICAVHNLLKLHRVLVPA